MEDRTLLLLTVIVFAAIGILALRNRLLFFIGVRNIKKRFGSSVLVISGLLIGTAIISSSLTLGDTMNYIFEKDVYDRLGVVDETVWSFDADGSPIFFNYSYYETIERELAPSDHVDGVSPMLVIVLPVMDHTTDLAEPSATIIGFNASIDKDFWGPDTALFTTIDGDVIDGTGLDAAGVLVNERFAEEVEAKRGDVLSIYYGMSGLNVTVSGVVENTGMGNYGGGNNVFIPLETLQTMSGHPGRINAVKISNEGGAEDGARWTQDVKSRLEEIFDSNALTGLEVRTDKQDGLENAEKSSEQISEIFMIMGMFSIIAGSVLIVLIFSMLAEERKTEMGIARAVGMQRSHLMQTFMFEGTIYAVIAAVIGAVVGLGIAWGILYAFNEIFGEPGSRMIFHFEFSSLITAISLGILLMLATITVASWMVSKLNIIRAIRKIPEPGLRKPGKKHMALGIFLMVSGAFLTFWGVTENVNVAFVAGPCFLFLGSALVSIRWVRPKVPFSLAGLGIVVWVLNPLRWIKGSGPDMFIVAGVLIVGGAVMFIMFNSDMFLNGLLLIFGRIKSLAPVLKTAISYPMKKKIRTAMILAMFSLIIFTVTVVATFSSMQTGSVNTTLERQAGGYDIIATVNPQTPLRNFSRKIDTALELNSGDFLEIAALRTAYAEMRNVDDPESSSTYYQVIGVDDEFIENNDYTFYRTAAGYDSSGEVWEALRTDRSLAVADRNVEAQEWEDGGGGLKVDVGQTLSVQNYSGGSRNLTIIGILDEGWIYQTVGIFTARENVADDFFVTDDTMYIIELGEGADAGRISHALEREFLSSGVQVIVIGDVINEFLRIESSIMTLMEAYMGLGLIVGVVGLGIITTRAVVERTREIGMLRAIGFQKNMILKSFLIENSFIVILACIVGVLLGLGIGYHVYLDYFETRTDFIIPWVHIIILTSVTYTATMLCTIPSARRAANLPITEALRFVE